MPSCGTISTSLDPIYSFGIPRQVQMSGIIVDIDAVVANLWAKNNDANVSKTVAQQMGMMISALEHQIPELFFTNEEHPCEAVSAVKALAVASAEGQRIYQITSENVNAVLPVLNISSEVKDEIRSSVAVGQEATVSQNNITVAGWTGVGYIITDPETGAGAYRISGGGNGGYLNIASGYLMIIIGMLIMSTLGWAVWMSGFTIAMLGIIYIGIGLWQVTGDESWVDHAINTVMYFYLGLLSVALPVSAFIIGLIWIFLMEWVKPSITSSVDYIIPIRNKFMELNQLISYYAGSKYAI